MICMCLSVCVYLYFFLSVCHTLKLGMSLDFAMIHLLSDTDPVTIFYRTIDALFFVVVICLILQTYLQFFISTLLKNRYNIAPNNSKKQNVYIIFSLYYFFFSYDWVFMSVININKNLINAFLLHRFV